MKKIAIHQATGSFSQQWISYCQSKGIPYKIVNCYENDIVSQLDDCAALMWHHHQTSSRDPLFAKQLLFSLQQSGKVVFPDFNTGWHFDDKLGQKYLFEALRIRGISTVAFYSRPEALKWVRHTDFPKVFKLRGGAAAANVVLVKSRAQAEGLVKRAFGKGISQYNAWKNLKDRFSKYKAGKSNFKEVLKGVIRLFFKPKYASVLGRERGYVYFQDYLPGNDSDIRVVIIDKKAFALKRMVREGDFRASGSGIFKFDRSEFDERCIRMAFDITSKKKAQWVAFDFVFHASSTPCVVEISYGFGTASHSCPGYWDEDLNWFEGKVRPQEWMVDAVLKQVELGATDNIK